MLIHQGAGDPLASQDDAACLVGAERSNKPAERDENSRYYG